MYTATTTREIHLTGPTAADQLTIPLGTVVDVEPVSPGSVYVFTAGRHVQVEDTAVVRGRANVLVLTDEEMAVIAGALAPESADVWVQGIHSDSWDRLQSRVFPVQLFHGWARQHGHPDDVHDGTTEGTGYDPEAGL